MIFSSSMTTTERIFEKLKVFFSKEVFAMYKIVSKNYII